MPVRIVFEGLMLFQFPETGPNAGKFVAYLINDAEFGSGKKGPAHDHDTEILILTGQERGTALVPTVLKRKATLDIVVPGKKGASPSPSFRRHVADLGAVIENAIPAIRNAGRGDPKRDLVQNIVTVDRGIVRVKDVAVWDQGGYPLSGGPGDGERATSPVVVKFMGSSVQGHMASKVVVEIDAEEVQLECDHDSRFNVPKRGSANPTDPHMEPRTVEIRITNYERPGAKPTPWGLDFQWLFAAAGYNAADLSGTEFSAWVGAGRAYDRKLFDVEREIFLGGAQHTIGRPFPYIESENSLTALQPLQPPQPLTSPPKILVCVFAVVSTTDVVMPAETLKLSRTAARKQKQPAKAPAKPKKGPAKPKKAPAKPKKAKQPKKR